MATSCGIIPFRINDNGQYEFFVGHPGGAYNAKEKSITEGVLAIDVYNNSNFF